MRSDGGSKGERRRGERQIIRKQDGKDEVREGSGESKDSGGGRGPAKESEMKTEEERV